jgi:hypothetical protein
MFTTFTFRRLRLTTPRLRTVFTVAFASALLAVPAIASAAKAPALRVDLGGPATYCPSGGPSAPTSSVGNAQLTTDTATSPGFHPVNVDVKVRGGKLAAGSYQVWLVELYRDDTGAVMGCSAAPFSGSLVVKGGAPAEFRGSVDRYTGQHELQIFVGSLEGAGYGSAASLVDVP